MKPITTILFGNNISVLILTYKTLLSVSVFHESGPVNEFILIDLEFFAYWVRAKYVWHFSKHRIVNLSSEVLV